MSLRTEISPGERLDRLESMMSGAINSIAAMTEAAQARIPFYVDTAAAQNFSATAPNVYTLSPQPLAAQLVRVTGIVAVVQGSTAAVLGAASLTLDNSLTLPLLDISTANVFALALNITPCSRFVDTISQKSIKLSVTAAGTGTIQLALWLWGEQVPATGMVS